MLQLQPYRMQSPSPTFLRRFEAPQHRRLTQPLEYAVELLGLLFCFFDEGKVVIQLNGFLKKTQKTPKNEIDKALQLMAEYYEGKR